MVKTVSLPLRVYDDLTKVSQELSLMAKKPISAPMAIDLLMEIYRTYLNNPCTLDAFSQQLLNSNLMSPEEFDKYWDEPTPQTQKRKTKSRKQ